MFRKLFSISLLCLFLFSSAFTTAEAQSDYDYNDYADRLFKALNVPKKTGVDGLQQDRELGQLRMTIGTMKNISTALEMFSTDNRGKYPVSLNQLTPNYLRSMPEGLSKTGKVSFVYTQKNGGKDYIFYCKGVNYSQFSIPADYPRCISNSGKRFNTSEIYLKPGVANPPYRKPTAKSKVKDEFQELVVVLPELLQKRDPKQAKEVRLKMTKLIKSGYLGPQEIEMGNRLIKTCIEIEQEKKK